MRVTIGLTCAVPSTSLVWPWNCGSAMRHGDHGDQAGQDVVALDAHGAVLEVHLELARVVLHGLADLLGDAVEESVDVHAAARGLDHVDGSCASWCRIR